MEAKLKHLELIQGVINRLATTSSRVKQWTVILTASIGVLFALTDGSEFLFAGLLIVLGIIIAFWILDGYYLSQERMYRALYDEIRGRANEEIDFSMDCKKFNSGRRTCFRAAISFTQLLYYGAICVYLSLLYFLVV